MGDRSGGGGEAVQGEGDVLPHLPEQVHDWVTSADFERLLRETVDATYPERERDQFMAHFKGLTDLWAADNKHERPHPEGVTESRAVTR